MGSSSTFVDRSSENEQTTSRPSLGRRVGLCTDFPISTFDVYKTKNINVGTAVMSLTMEPTKELVHS